MVNVFMVAQAIKSLVLQKINWSSNNIRVMLVTDQFTPNKDTLEFASQVTHQVSGTHYTQGGATLSGRGISYDPATDRYNLTAAAVEWVGFAGTVRWGIIYDDTHAEKPVLGVIDFGGNVSHPYGIRVEWQNHQVFSFVL